MNPGIIYGKTDKGRAEFVTRSQVLSPVQRRVLIMIDGKKALIDLGAFVRVGELDDAISALVQEGMIESTSQEAILQPPVAPGFSAFRAAEGPRPATSELQFKSVRNDASRFVSERLGAAGEPICAAIDRCDSPQDLRKLLRGVEIFVGQRLGAETTQAFARHFGSLLL